MLLPNDTKDGDCQGFTINNMTERDSKERGVAKRKLILKVKISKLLLV